MSIERFQDINISDNIYKNDYSNKYNEGEYNSAYNILDNNYELKNKIFLAEIINSISSLLYNNQEDYYINTNNYLEDLSEKFQLVIDNYKYLGEWNSQNVYRIYNIVVNSNKYYMYINPIAASNILVTNSSYWLPLELKGKTGADGIGVNFLGTWDSTTTYNALDGIYYDGAIWCAKESNTNQIPNSNSNYWGNVVTFLKAKIIIGSTEPINKYEGLIWMEILS